MNNKGFTLLELLATIAIIGILTTIAVFSITKYINKGKEETYANHEKTLKRAAQNYMADNLDHIGIINASELHTKGYLEDLKDPKSKNSCLNDSFVSFETSQEANSFNTSYTYTICLKCDTYQSSGCS